MKTLIFSIFLVSSLFAFDFNLKPIKLNKNSYYFEGKKEYFSNSNGGDISNSSFIITKNSVILIDTGSSYAYAKQVKEQIKKITNKKIKYIINTHHHPDHFLGNNAFDDVQIYASEYTQNNIKQNGELYINNMVNLLGKTSYETRKKAPNNILASTKLILDDYELEVLYFDGHTSSDVAIYDKTTKTIYTSDLIFNQRALATPHANIPKWIKSLESLKNIDFDILVPGHGKYSFSRTVIDENIEYLTYLHNTLLNAVNEGLDSFEILSKEHPQKIKSFAMFEEEFERSVINLYPKYERAY